VVVTGSGHGEIIGRWTMGSAGEWSCVSRHGKNPLVLKSGTLGATAMDRGLQRWRKAFMDEDETRIERGTCDALLDGRDRRGPATSRMDDDLVQMWDAAARRDCMT